LRIEVTYDTYLDALNLLDGSFYPLDGFPHEPTFRSVVASMRTPDGKPWPIPIMLDVDRSTGEEATSAGRVTLTFNGRAFAELRDVSTYSWNKEWACRNVFGVADHRHPGVKRMFECREALLGGAIVPNPGYDSGEEGLTPAETRDIIKRKGWHRVVGFQTRNPVHRAHEYLQRSALEVCDGILIQPIVGWKKPGDFQPEVVLRTYRRMLDSFYPPDRVILTGLRTAMRYAGPREAVFHALIRRNYGCTHFIVGRDHAGVMGFYGKYDAHRLCEQFPDLGVEVLTMHEPRYCRRCGQVATEKTCRHNGEDIFEISGTDVRSLLASGLPLPVEIVRPEIAELLLEAYRRGELFC
jgi:sulfate adenylyltransferase